MLAVASNFVPTPLPKTNKVHVPVVMINRQCSDSSFACLNLRHYGQGMRAQQHNLTSPITVRINQHPGHARTSNSRHLAIV